MTENRRRHYTAKFKKEAVELVTRENYTVAQAARSLGVPEQRIPAALDRVLSLLKYVVLGVILLATWRTGELVFRGYDPCYALISRHGTDITVWAYVVTGMIAVASLVVAMPFCRWFCPFATVQNWVEAGGKKI